MYRISRQTRGAGRFIALAFSFALVGLSAVPAPAQNNTKEANQRVLFASDRETADAFAIYAMNPDGSGQTRISKGTGVAFDPSWSPDHKQILYTYVASKEKTRSELMVMKADGTEPTSLVSSEEKTLFLSPLWSPDGKRIAYTAANTSNGKPKATIYVIDADGKNRKDLGAGFAPVWSPNGKRLLFSVFPDSNGVPDMKVMDADGANAKIFPAKGIGPAWSPDGKHIAFTGDGAGVPNLFVMDEDGSHITQLTKDADSMALGVVWTQDGKHLLFTRLPTAESADKPKMQICLMDADGSHITSVTKEGSFLGIGASLLLLARSSQSK